MRNPFALAIAAGALLPLAGFAARASAAPQRPTPKPDIEIVLKDKRLVEPSVEGLSFVFYLAVANASSAPEYLAKYDYRVEVEGIEYINLQTELDVPIKIEPKSETPLALPVKITYAYLFDSVPGAKDKDVVACVVTGGMTFRDERRREKRVPLVLTTEAPIYRGLDLRLLPIEVKDITVGGADIVVKAALRNLNGFGFTLEGFSYKMDLVGTTVATGVAGRGAFVEGRGEATFSIPLLLDFFEIGKEIYDGLTQPPVAVRIEGSAEIGTTWGTFQIPVGRSDKVAVKAVSR